MFIVKERHSLHYHESDHGELVPALHDTYFQEKNGQVFAQFTAGQLISREVFDLVFGTQPEPVEVKPQEAVVEEVVSEVVEELAVEEAVEAEPELKVQEVLEVEQPVKEEEVQSKFKGKKKK